MIDSRRQAEYPLPTGGGERNCRPSTGISAEAVRVRRRIFGREKQKRGACTLCGTEPLIQRRRGRKGPTPSDSLSDSIATGPRPLEIVAAGPIGHIHHFTDEEYPFTFRHSMVLDESTAVSTPPTVTSASGYASSPSGWSSPSESCTAKVSISRCGN